MGIKFATIGLGKVGGAISDQMRAARHEALWYCSSQQRESDVKIYADLPPEPFGAEAVFLAVPDGVIREMAEKLASTWGSSCSGVCFFHFSGLISSAVLQPLKELGAEVASLHPLQTIMNTEQIHKAIQECYFTGEGSERAMLLAREIIDSLGSNLQEIRIEDKVLYHASAVVASNHMVALMSQAAELMSAVGLDVAKFMPLVRNTLDNIEAYGRYALTGPIQRGDWDTVRSHVDEIDRRFPDILPSYLEVARYTASLAGRDWPRDIGVKDNLLGWDELAERVAMARERGLKVVFTNGCFDILHAGHVSYLQHARNVGHLLVVGLNSDDSVRRLNKGPERPLNTQSARAKVLGALGCVDYVTIFDEDTPYELIKRIMPDILVKGGDWDVEKIVGADIVRAAGGEVYSIPFEDGFSTTGIVAKIKENS